MQQTSNYNLNLPEGTDVVNPLVDYNPNFSTIDSAMKANADRTVGRATCIKSGTTHVITRSNTGSNIINFTATGDWNEGDTMTIDSVIVSVFLPDGNAALDGAYLINTEVFGILNGTRFTLYSNKVDLSALENAKADKSDIAAIENGTTASRAYSAGELVYVSGVLYIVKTAIAIGTAFTVGANVEVTNVSEALKDSIKMVYDQYFTATGTGAVYIDIDQNYPMTGYKLIGINIASSAVGYVVQARIRSDSRITGTIQKVNGGTITASESVQIGLTLTYQKA